MAVVPTINPIFRSRPSNGADADVMVIEISAPRMVFDGPSNGRPSRNRRSPSRGYARLLPRIRLASPSFHSPASATSGVEGEPAWAFVSHYYTKGCFPRNSGEGFDTDQWPPPSAMFAERGAHVAPLSALRKRRKRSSTIKQGGVAILRWHAPLAGPDPSRR